MNKPKSELPNRDLALRVWISEGMPEAIARRQYDRLEAGKQSDLELANRIGNIRTVIDDETWWKLFDAVEESRTWESLDQAWREIVIFAENKKQEQMKKAGWL